jgi:hypothetical protein
MKRIAAALYFSLVVPLVLFGAACGVKDDIDEAVDVLDGVGRHPIDVSRTGVNAFGSDTRFGSTCQQYQEIQQSLKLTHLRVLFRWSDGVQSGPGSEPFFGFYDEIADCVPAGMDALVVVTGMPAWMQAPANWSGGNPRRTFVEEFFLRVVERYAGHSRIAGFQVWNEPNNTSDADNQLMGFNDPALYVEMLAEAYRGAKAIAPGKLIVNAATTSVQQNFSDTLDYNKAMRSAGAEDYVDVWAIHYYGRQFETLMRGVQDFLNGLRRPIWVTESGQQGVNEQLRYVEEAWPYLKEKVPGIDRFYYYCFESGEPSASAYGLRTTDPAFPVSDLYVYLRDR